MDKPLRTERHGEYELSLWHDDAAECPLHFDNLYIVAAWDQRHWLKNSIARDLVDKEDRYDSEKDWLRSMKGEEYVAFYFSYVDYGSGGVRLTEVDKSADGVFYATKHMVEREWMEFERDKDRLRRMFNHEMETIEAWCNGEVYGYVIREECPHCKQLLKEPVESCFGYYNAYEKAWEDGLRELKVLTVTGRSSDEDETNSTED